MKLELRENMYGRTFNGYIVKILNVKDDWIETDTRFVIRTFPQDFVKASYNIIDILEMGDILIDDTNRKLEVLLIDNELMVRNEGLIYDNNYYLPIKSIVIKSVITHEQMEQMAYKVEE